MDDRTAIIVVDQGITYEELRDLMDADFGEERSITIPRFTKAEAHKHLRACVDRKFGRVPVNSADALTARLIICEFWKDR